MVCSMKTKNLSLLVILAATLFLSKTTLVLADEPLAVAPPSLLETDHGMTLIRDFVNSAVQSRNNNESDYFFYQKGTVKLQLIVEELIIPTLMQSIDNDEGRVSDDIFSLYEAVNKIAESISLESFSSEIEVTVLPLLPGESPITPNEQLQIFKEFLIVLKTINAPYKKQLYGEQY